MMRIFIRILLFLSSASLVGAIERVIDNPKPASGDLILPMPAGRQMVFRPVFLGIGNAPFALREVILGSRANEGFRETPTKVQIGGSFLGDTRGRQDWLYYIGKYEVTGAQFAAVMHPDALASSAEEAMPKTSVTWLEIQEFLERYNLWLLANAKGVLPSQDGVSGFVRLPLEAEWEFAARGGSVVDGGQFDLKTPYKAGQLPRYEWFSGPRSSHDKLKAIGLLEPNPLGVHDMLGNAAEFVDGYYQVEYTQGRLGGHIVRGADFRTSEAAVRSSARMEVHPFTSDGKSVRQDNVGFRLVLAVPVFSDVSKISTLESAWKKYAETRAVPAPGVGSMAPVVQQTSFQISGIDKILSQLESELSRPTREEDSVRAQLHLLRTSFADIDATIRRAEKVSAQGGVRLASLGAFGIVKALLHEKLAADLPEKDRERWHGEAQKNLQEARERIVSAFKQLSELRPEVVQEEFKSWIQELKERKIEDQCRATVLASDHFEQYRKSKRLEMEGWEKDYLKETEASLSRYGSGQ